MRQGRWVVVAMVAALVVGCGERSNLEIMESARSYLARKDTPAASIELRTLLQRKPDAAEARFLLGKIHFEAGEMVEAEDQLGLALQYGYPEDEVVPLLAEALTSLNRSKALLTKFGDLQLEDRAATADLKVLVATAYVRERDFDNAQRAVDRALALVPEHPAALALRARLLAIGGDVPAAQREVDLLLVKSPDSPDALALKGDLLMMATPGQTDAAIAMHRRALALRPRLPQSHAAILSMLLASGDLEGASGQWQALKAALPQHPQTQFFEGVLALRKGDADRARLIANRMLESSPIDLRLLLLGSQSAMQLGDWEQAEAQLAKAVGIAATAPLPRYLLAEIYLRTGRPEYALSVLEPLIGFRVRDPVALTLAGRAHLVTGNVAAAKAAFDQAQALAPDDKRVRTATALARLGSGQTATALAELESIAKADSGTGADLALVSARLAQRQFDEAAKAADALAAKIPKQALPDHLRGRIALARGDKSAARMHFEAALAKESGYVPALRSLVALDLADGKPAEAQERLEAARKSQPGNTQIRLALASLIEQRGAPVAEVTAMLDEAVRLRPTDPAAQVALVDHHLAAGRRELALTTAEKAVAAIPDNREVLDSLGLAQLARGGSEQAIATYNKMIVQWPRASLGYQRLAEIYLNKGDNTQAGERAQMALKESPRLVPAQRVAAVVALRQRKPDQALAIARKVQEQRPREPVGYELEGEVAMALRRFDRAEGAFRKALERGAPSEVARRLHLALLGARRPEDARRWADDWTKRHPKDTSFVVHLADVALGTGNLAQAEIHYRDAMERLPGNALAMNNLAYVLIKQGKPGGLALAERAAKLAPNSAAVLDTVATGYAADKQLAKAIEWQRKAVDAAPDAGMMRLALARLYIQASEREKALAELDRLAKAGRKFSGYNEVAQLRKKLGP